nr:MAG TPA: hypothetical protein [Caudoviricetes sp.]
MTIIKLFFRTAKLFEKKNFVTFQKQPFCKYGTHAREAYL